MSKVEVISPLLACGEFVSRAEVEEVFRIKYGDPTNYGVGTADAAPFQLFYSRRLL